MITPEETSELLYGKTQKHNIPIEHFDFKYIEKCNNAKELEKIYKILSSGVEGKYQELENFTYEKLKNLAPNSRALRKDLPITPKTAISKEDQKQLDDEINNFLNKIPELEEKIKTDKNSLEEIEVLENENFQPIRNSVVLNTNSKDKKTQVLKKEPLKSNVNKKSPKPKDYKEWDKIEKELEKEFNENENENENENTTKPSNDVTHINTNNLTKKLVKNLSKNIKTEDITDEQKELRADMEKCKGNEAFNSGCFEEALVYYTRSIQLLPNAASYNNRAMTYLKLEKWDKAIEDCEFVLKYENANLKARLRRATAFLKKKKFTEAKYDLDFCLKVEPKNKKAMELKKELESKLKANDENIAKLNGANRLLIEDTDGSSSEDEEIVQIEINETKKTATPIQTPSNPIGNPNETTSVDIQKQAIRITEVENDDDDDQSEDEEKLTDPIEKSNNPKEKVENFFLNDVKLEIPEKVARTKDSAFKHFSSGQYAAACDLYKKAITELKEEIKSNQNERLISYYNSTLVIFLNNKAACNQKIGEYKSCIADCNEGLNLITLITKNDPKQIDEFKNQKLKLIYKKASSFELLEKYSDAFVEYQTLMRLDSSFQNAQQNYNRIRTMLKENGELEKILIEAKKTELPKEVVKNQTQEEIKKIDARTYEKLDEVIDVNKVYEDYKTKGNECVKQNDFEKALIFYNKCIQINSENPIAYLNRSLCYVKLNQPDLAIIDCSLVLKNDDKNVKALYRRATANKMKGMNNLVAEDLKSLLSIEPNNQIAIKEFESIKKILQTSSPSLQEKVLNKKVELSDKVSNESIQSKTKSACIEIKTKKLQSFDNISNPYEFLQAWNSINPKDKEGFAKLLSCIEPAQLPKLIGSKLDDEMLSILVDSIYTLSFNHQSKDRTFEYLKQLGNTQRFNITKLFLNSSQISMLRNVIKDFDETNAEIVKSLFGI